MKPNDERFRDEDDRQGASNILPGIGFALLSTCGFGAIAPVAKIAYNKGAEPLPLLATRFIIAVILLVLVHRMMARPLQFAQKSHALRLLLLGGLAFGSGTWLFFLALELAPAGIVSLVFFSFPFITAIITVVFGLEPPRLRTFAALTIGSVGVASIFGIAGLKLHGLLLALGAAIAVAIYFVLAGIFVQGTSASAAATWTSAGAAISLSAAAIASGQLLPVAALPAGIGLGILTTLAFTTLYAAIARIGASRAAVAQMFEPVVTVVLAALFLGERVTGRILLGGALILFSLPVLYQRRSSASPVPL